MILDEEKRQRDREGSQNDEQKDTQCADEIITYEIRSRWLRRRGYQARPNPLKLCIRNEDDVLAEDSGFAEDEV